MITTKLIVLGVLALMFSVLLWHRLFVSNRYANLLGLNAVITFGTSYLVFDQTIGALIYSQPTLLLQSFDGVLRKVLGILFFISVAYFINALIQHFVYTRRLTWEGDSKVPLLIQYLVTALLYLIAMIFVVGHVFEQSITGLVAASGAVVLVLGYSARTMVDEIVAGIAINIKAPFEKGDLIQLNDEWGYVKEIDWRSITYLDMDNNHVVVPNTKLAASKIRNLDRPTTITRRVLFIQVEYNIPPQVVVDECTAVMSECPNIIAHPLNFASYFDSDEKGMRYRVHFHVKSFDDWWLGSDQSSKLFT